MMNWQLEDELFSSLNRGTDMLTPVFDFQSVLTSEKPNSGSVIDTFSPTAFMKVFNNSFSNRSFCVHNRSQSMLGNSLMKLVDDKDEDVSNFNSVRVIRPRPRPTFQGCCTANDVIATSFCQASSGQEVLLGLPPPPQLLNEMTPDCAGYRCTGSGIGTPELASSSTGGSRNSSDYRIPCSDSSLGVPSDLANVQFTHVYDVKIFDITKVSAYDFASQLTLLFLPVFKAIQPDELTSLGWIRKEKSQLAPNIVEFTKLFNNINYWVQEECLKEAALQRRAEVLSHFVKIAKELMKLNNIHGAMAVMAALQSEPIYRLKKTWALIGNRLHSFEKISFILNQEDNRINLRKYMENIKLPVIPYLGMYTYDLVYIDSMYPSTGGLECQSRLDQVNNLLRTLAEFQRSEYNCAVKPYLSEYLQQKHYIEELQSFLDKENYVTSLRLESEHPRSFSLEGCIDLAPCHSCVKVVITKAESTPQSSMDDSGEGAAGFFLAHRKTKSLGNGVNHIIDVSSPSPQSSAMLSDCATPNISFSSGSASRNLVDDTPMCTSTTKALQQQQQQQHLARSDHRSPKKVFSEESALTVTTLLHRSASSPVGFNERKIFTPTRPAEATHLANLTCAEDRPVEPSSLVVSHLYLNQDSSIICEGCACRKTVMRAGRPVRSSVYKRFWMTLVCREDHCPYLVYFAAKSWNGIKRSDFKHTPTKEQSLADCLVMQTGAPFTFQLVFSATGKNYKFRLSAHAADSHSSLEQWISEIDRHVKKFKEPKDLISFEPLLIANIQTVSTKL